MINMIDSHLHLDSSDFNADREDVLERARKSGVKKFINAGTTIPSSEAGITLSCVHPDIYPAVGIHPHEAYQLDAIAMESLHKLALSPGVIAIGETGLDYHYNFSLPEIQRTAFRHHIRLAREVKLPLIIHCRDAFGDLIHILREEKGNKAGGVVHCFTGNCDEAERVIEMGFYIGITGIVTFKAATTIIEVVKRLPLDRLLIETDAPYLAPHPHRGKRNEPSLLIHIAEQIAEIKNMPLEDIINATTCNTKTIFHLK